jgi:hypothetical protein
MNIESVTFRFHGQSGYGFSRRQMALKIRLKPKLLLEKCQASNRWTPFCCVIAFGQEIAPNH